MAKQMTASQMGKKGGRRRAQTQTKEQLSAIGKKAAKARWAQKGKKA